MLNLKNKTVLLVGLGAILLLLGGIWITNTSIDLLAPVTGGFQAPLMVEIGIFGVGVLVFIVFIGSCIKKSLNKLKNKTDQKRSESIPKRSIQS